MNDGEEERFRFSNQHLILQNTLQAKIVITCIVTSGNIYRVIYDFHALMIIVRNHLIVIVTFKASDVKRSGEHLLINGVLRRKLTILHYLSTAYCVSGVVRNTAAVEVPR